MPKEYIIKRLTSDEQDQIKQSVEQQASAELYFQPTTQELEERLKKAEAEKKNFDEIGESYDKWMAAHQLSAEEEAKLKQFEIKIAKVMAWISQIKAELDRRKLEEKQKLDLLNEQTKQSEHISGRHGAVTSGGVLVGRPKPAPTMPPGLEQPFEFEDKENKKIEIFIGLYVDAVRSYLKIDKKLPDETIIGILTGKKGHEKVRDAFIQVKLLLLEKGKRMLERETAMYKIFDEKITDKRLCDLVKKTL